MKPSTAGAVGAVARLTVGLERAGWSLVACELDLDRQTARIELKRTDGLLVTLDAQEGRCLLLRHPRDTRAKSE